MHFVAFKECVCARSSGWCNCVHWPSERKYYGQTHNRCRNVISCILSCTNYCKNKTKQKLMLFNVKIKGCKSRMNVPGSSNAIRCVFFFYETNAHTIYVVCADGICNSNLLGNVLIKNTIKIKKIRGKLNEMVESEWKQFKEKGYHLSEFVFFSSLFGAWELCSSNRNGWNFKR